jgi:hypothetical protein
LKTWLSSNNDIRICLLDKKLSWTKNAFCDVNNKIWRKWDRFVYPFLFKNTYGLPVYTTDTKSPNLVFYVWLVDLQTICAKYRLETWFSGNDDIRIRLFDMRHSRTKNAFWDVNIKKWRIWCKFIQLYYLITHMAYLCSQWTSNVQIKYFMFPWSICRLFVLNGGLRSVSLKIMIFVYVWATWGLVEIKTHFEPWITRNDVNDLS